MNMSDDGAHLGYGMEAALKGALGGEEPPKRMTTAETREYILSAPDLPTNYDDYGRAVAKLVLGFLERHPEASDMPADSEHDWSKFDGGDPPPLLREGLYDYIKRTEPGYGRAIFEEMTGFMWGWGVNAARRCLELPPVANPAIVTIGGSA